VQNKMHWAAHDHTAAEVPRKVDVAIAKSYLGAEELDALNRIVTAYLEFAELQAMNRKPMYMADWIAKLDDFLALSDRELLYHAGRVSHDDAVTSRAGVQPVRERASGTSGAGRAALRGSRARREAARERPACFEARDAAREAAQEAMTCRYWASSRFAISARPAGA
jgi:virulence RhuM family protein